LPKLSSGVLKNFRHTTLGKEIHLTGKQAKASGVFAKREINVAAGDWLSIQANVRGDAFQFTNGERVKVAHVNAQGGRLLEDGRTIPHNFRQFNHGYCRYGPKKPGQKRGRGYYFRRPVHQGIVLRRRLARKTPHHGL
jgi:hypothetical protein